MLAPVAPFIAEELWRETLGHPGSVHRERWPEHDEALARLERVTLVVQVDGRVRDRIEVEPDISEEEAVRLALASENARRFLDGGEPARIVPRPPRLVNLVTR